MAFIRTSATDNCEIHGFSSSESQAYRHENRYCLIVYRKVDPPYGKEWSLNRDGYDEAERFFGDEDDLVQKLRDLKEEGVVQFPYKYCRFSLEYMKHGFTENRACSLARLDCPELYRKDSPWNYHKYDKELPDKLLSKERKLIRKLRAQLYGELKQEVPQIRGIT